MVMYKIKVKRDNTVVQEYTYNHADITGDMINGLLLIVASAFECSPGELSINITIKG